MPHSEKNVLSRFFFALFRHFKQLLDTLWNYKAMYNTGIILERMCLLSLQWRLFLRTKILFPNNTVIINCGVSENIRCDYFQWIVPKESDEVPTRNQNVPSWGKPTKRGIRIPLQTESQTCQRSHDFNTGQEDHILSCVTAVKSFHQDNSPWKGS